MNDVIIDFVARGLAPNEWRLVLVEQGPWQGDVAVALRRLQERLYGCLDVALDGEIAARFPQTRGGNLVIQIDSYDIARESIEPFFSRFSSQVFSIPEYKDALNRNRFVKSIRFELNIDAIH